MKRSDLNSLFISVDHSIRDAIVCIDQNERGIALVVDGDRRLLGTISDGDIRRAMLANLNLDHPVSVILGRKATSPYPTPVTAPVGTSPEALIDLMRRRVIQKVPLLDVDGRVADVAVLEELLPGTRRLELQAVIMAGGFGTRLRPLTEDVPKPMLKIGGKPLLEMIVEQLRQAGIHQVNVATHYKPTTIFDHFGDGRTFGVQLKYVNEERPLGTGGALGLMPPPAETVLVMNGDIVTQIDFRAMLAYHREHATEMTIGVRQYDVRVPYGVVECDGSHVRGLSEKPELRFFVNAGIYLLEPSVYNLIPRGEHFNMTDLIQWLLDAHRPVISFPIREYWLDVGQREDYEQAQRDAESTRMAP
jgi:dTDP-glucose pyrophosphorylase